MTQSKIPLVVVVTINYNHAIDTIKCLESILESKYNNIEVIVVDNGSSEYDFQILNSYCSNSDKLKLIRLYANKGYVGGVNFGLANASESQPDYYLIMNNDTIIDKEAVFELVRVAKMHNDNCIVSGKVYNMDEPDTLQYIGQWCKNSQKLDYPPFVKESREKDVGQYENEIELGMADDIFWLLPHKIQDKIGYYSTDFFLYGEQNDYALRVLHHGFKLIYTPKAKIWHYFHLTTSDGNLKSMKILYWETYGALLVAYKHLSFVRFLHFYLNLFVKSFVKYVLNFNKNNNYSAERKTKLIAVLYFTKWIFSRRKPNEGFNPFS
jgi:GT2 family glycosyltransferase